MNKQLKEFDFGSPQYANKRNKEFDEKHKFTTDQIKAFKIFEKDLTKSVKKFKAALTKNDFLEIRSAGYSVNLVSNWILDIIKKLE